MISMECASVIGCWSEEATGVPTDAEEKSCLHRTLGNHTLLFRNIQHLPKPIFGKLYFLRATHWLYCVRWFIMECLLYGKISRGSVYDAVKIFFLTQYSAVHILFKSKYLLSGMKWIFMHIRIKHTAWSYHHYSINTDFVLLKSQWHQPMYKVGQGGKDAHFALLQVRDSLG